MIKASTRLEGARLPADDNPLGFTRYARLAVVITVLGYSLGYSTIGFGMLFLGALWSLARYGRIPWARTPLDRPLAILAGVLVLSALGSPYRGVAVVITLMFLVSGAVYFGAFSLLLREAAATRMCLFQAWAAGAAAAAVVGLAYVAADHFGARPAMGLHRAEIPRGVGPNGLGTTLMLGAILSLGLAFKARDRQRVLWMGVGLLCFVGLLASGSRASFAGWFAAATYLVWRELRTRPWRMAAVAAAGLILFGGIAATVPQLASRVPSTVADVSGNRLRIWHTSLEMIADRPLLGTGFGTFERTYDRRRALGMSAEPFAFNLWLNLAVETGLLGLAAAVGVAVAAVRTWTARAGGGEEEPSRSVLAALWVSLLVDQFADNTLFSISTSAAAWLLLAMTVVRPRIGAAEAGSAETPS